MRKTSTWLAATTWQQRTTLGLIAAGVATSVYLIVHLLGLEIHIPGISPAARTPGAVVPAGPPVRPARVTPRLAPPAATTSRLPASPRRRAAPRVNAPVSPSAPAAPASRGGAVAPAAARTAPGRSSRCREDGSVGASGRRPRGCST